MLERRRTDLPARLFQAALLVLLASAALNLAVSLILDVWPWLVGLLVGGTALLLLTRLVVWWSRRRFW